MKKGLLRGLVAIADVLWTNEVSTNSTGWQIAEAPAASVLNGEKSPMFSRLFKR